MSEQTRQIDDLPSCFTPPLPVLEFFYNWNNKLDCQAFTSLRLFNPMKFQKGTRFQVMLGKGDKAQDKGIVEVVDSRQTSLNELNEWMCRLDTGYDLTETTKIIQKMYKAKNLDWNTQKLSWVLFKKVYSQPTKDTMP